MMPWSNSGSIAGPAMFESCRPSCAKPCCSPGGSRLLVRSSIGPDSFEPVVPDYQLLRPIGAGSFGQVWLAQTLVGVFRAIKIIRRKSFQNTIQFDREFSALRKIESISTHESLVDVLHVGRNE